MAEGPLLGPTPTTEGTLTMEPALLTAVTGTADPASMLVVATRPAEPYHRQTAPVVEMLQLRSERKFNLHVEGISL